MTLEQAEAYLTASKMRAQEAYDQLYALVRELPLEVRTDIIRTYIHAGYAAGEIRAATLLIDLLREDPQDTRQWLEERVQSGQSLA